MQPFEIIAAPFTIYVAPVGTAFPAVDAAPATFSSQPGGAGPWFLVGTSGTKSYSDVGMTVTQKQTVGTFTPAGGTVVRKAWRTDEGMEIAFDLADVSPAQFALVMDNLALTTVAATTGVAGDTHFEVMRGFNVYSYALLARGPSAFNEALNAQYEVASCYQHGNPAPKYSPKGGPALLALQFEAYELTPGVMATLRHQSAAKI